MDFFGSRVPEPTRLEDDVDTFARAVSERSALNPAMSAATLAPKLALPSKKNLRPSSAFDFVEPNDLSPLFTNPSALIIDIRPHAAYASARIPTALSLSVPSTLLKRPLFSLDRLAVMLPSANARARFSEWPKFSTIVVYDVDSSGSPHLPEGNNVLGLLRKFANDSSYSGNTLLWLKGGFQRVWRERRDLVDLRPPDLEAEDDVNDSANLKTNQLPSSAFESATTTASPHKRPSSATSLNRPNAPSLSDKPAIPASVPFNPFFDTIRQNLELSHGVTERIPLRLPKRVRKRINDLPFEWLREISRHADVKPSSSSDADYSPSSPSDNEQPPSRPTRSSSPTSSGHRSSIDKPPTPTIDLTPPPPNQALLDEGMEVLAMQFYRIELAEQRRLMGVMKHHSAESAVVNSQPKDRPGSVDSVESKSGRMSIQDKPEDIPMLASTSAPLSDTSSAPHSAPIANSSEGSGRYRVRKPSALGSVSSGPPPSSNFSESDSASDGKGRKSNKHGKDPFPFSITAGVEKGAKNRYRHIWPFEHARVRLHRQRSLSRHHDHSSQPSSSSISLPFLKPSRASSSRPPSGALTGNISSGSESPRQSRMKARPGIKPSFGAGGLGLGRVPSPAFNFSSSALTAPALTGFNSSAIGGSALKPSFTSMRAPAPAAGSGGETTESDSEREASGRDEPKSEEYDDYVNASYVQPLCTSRRYIATQGPLEATFVDFWTLVYQQNVHVIVMLTREIEGSMVKCGPYWKNEVFGPLRLNLIKVEGNVDKGKDDDVKKKAAGGGGGDPGASGFFFFPTVPDAQETKPRRERKKDPADAIIKRTFLLSHVGYPHIPPRKVVQFQYLEWPDMNVPDDPRGVLGLIRQVDQAVNEATYLNEQGKEEEEGKSFNDMTNTIDSGVPAVIRPSFRPQSSQESLDRYTGIATQAMGKKHSPVLLHCSAGVGRTGGFIAVDAVLDGVRRELRRKRKQQVQGDSDALADAMDVEIVSEGQAIEDGEGNWNQSNATDIDMADVDEITSRTIAIPANNSGDVLHVPVHEQQMDNSPANSNSNSNSASHLRTPMQVDSSYTVFPTISDADKGGDIAYSEQKKRMAYQRQSSSTRMWAEDVSDQTGSHGTAVRVDEARRQMLSQERLNEWDASIPQSDATSSQGDILVPTSEESEERVEMDGVESSRQSMQGRDTIVTAGDVPVQAQSDMLPAPAILPLSSIDSLSSEDSYGFRSSFPGAHNRRLLGHQAVQSLPGESALPSSTGTSFSSLQSLPGSAISRPSSPQVITNSEGDLLPALNLRGEEARLRTWSAPSAQTSGVVNQTVKPDGTRTNGSKTLPENASSSSSFLRDRSRMVGKSPSPFASSKSSLHHDESVPPASRSLPPLASSAPNPQLPTGKSSGSNSGSADNSNGSGATSVPTVNLPTSESRSRTAPEAGKSAFDAISPAFITKSLSLPNDPGTDSRLAKAPHSVYNAKAGHSRQAVDANSQPTDLPYPRSLHGDHSPQALSTYEEPLMEVLRDMREQRMSLCQSLRQYVFVHAAIIEGALMIVDEERERERKETDMDVDRDGSPAMKHAAYQRRPGRAVSIASTPSASTGKRVASPTELPKEDKKGEQLLFKKPSMKRKPGSTSQQESWGFGGRDGARSGVTLQPPPP